MLRKGDKGSKNTVAAKKSNYRRFIEPAWGERPVRAITREDCAKLLADVRQEFEARGEQGTTVNVLRSNLGAFFKWCMTRYELGVKANPTFGLPRQVEENPEPPRPLEEWELKLFFPAAREVAAIPKRGGSALPYPYRRGVDATEFLLRSALRRNEVFDARWGWLTDDGLLVPGTHTKNKYPFLVPLTESMRGLIGQRPPEATDDGRIFEQNVRTLALAVEVIRTKMTKVAHITLHDFRDTFLDRMEEPRAAYDQPMFSFDVRDACLNHRPSGVGAKHYSKALREPRWRFPERKGAVQFWNEWLDRLKTEALGKSSLAA